MLSKARYLWEYLTFSVVIVVEKSRFLKVFNKVVHIENLIV